MKNRLVALMGAKQAAEGKVINATTVAKETGLTRQAIHKWLNGDIQEFRGETIESLCRYFKCEIGDLLYIDREEQVSA